MKEETLPEEMRIVPQSAPSPEDRMPPIAEADLSEAQRAAIAEFVETRGREPGGPFVPLLRSPEIMRAATHLGRHLRYETSLPMTLSELAIIVTARKWSQNYEWSAHRKIAEHAGLSREITEAVREGRRPEGMSADEATVYDFCQEVHVNGQVCDPTYARAKQAFGEQGVVELATLCGYYALLAIVLNVARTPLPAGAEPELVPFRR